MCGCRERLIIVCKLFVGLSKYNGDSWIIYSCGRTLNAGCARRGLLNYECEDDIILVNIVKCA